MFMYLSIVQCVVFFTGITSDAPISYIARHNLMQVAQILQVLAISSDVSGSPQNDLYALFEKVSF